MMPNHSKRSLSVGCKSEMPSNKPGAADGIKILVVMQRLSAAAEGERYAYPEKFS
ncbi:hypothetical protein [Coleofasciculus sp. H7-2]|uniref:hypothetical protein n=1 Tax=Coleofasciculus sp. H7-2 TaxID=3351545 RepID=UPI0036719A86